jgi:site-specific DNA-adenine methylase
MLSYIGGKSKIADGLIIPHIPKDIETYCEVFGGMFWVFFKMDLSQFPNLKKVIYNDVNVLNHNLFNCVRNPSELLKAVNDIPCQQYGVSETHEFFKTQFKEFQKELFSDSIIIKDCDYEIAAKYAYVISQVFSGSKPETSNFIDLKGKYKNKSYAILLGIKIITGTTGDA